MKNDPKPGIGLLNTDRIQRTQPPIQVVLTFNVTNGKVIDNLPLYPHLKLTNEEFPRILATRQISDEGDEYFGAFLTKTSVRILIDFLNRVFRLRSCDIEIDGNFPVPCTQYFAKRCLAPCVSKTCSRENYLEMVDIARLFLRNDREVFGSAVSGKIATAADNLDFETGAFWRDILRSVEEYWSRKRYQVWLDDAVDTYEIENIGDDASIIYLVTQRRRRMLGSLAFVSNNTSELNASEHLREIISGFYKFHLPKEIRVSTDFPRRVELANSLSKQFGRPLRINVVKESSLRVTTERALRRTKHEAALKSIIEVPSNEQIYLELQTIFGLNELPLRILAFDAAHISATLFAAAVAVWQNGGLVREQFDYVQSEQSSELQTLAAFAAEKLAKAETPQLVLIDGGRSQLQAVLKNLPSRDARAFKVIAAVKPAGKHSEISHFLDEDENKISFDISSNAHRVLKIMRDEAHGLANSIHGQTRDMQMFFEPHGVRPLIVPIRFDEPGGNAEDLRPIIAR
ncbi:MAG: hypothetical protein LC734_08765 [Acidobacteria bacterium]|nr:hypothetical protein [Acidobacteriota bacterium]